MNMTRQVFFGILLVILVPGMAVAADVGSNMKSVHEQDSRWKHFPQRSPAPDGAPNVLLVMTDDVGFAASSTFGGPVETPALDSLAESGLRYNTFHTTAMCSPSRAALLTGRNHHAVNSGAITNLSRDLRGYTSVIPDSAGTIADVLRLNGYNTGFFGKNHNTPEWENTPLGPFDHWPSGFGFDYFYGFNDAWANQFAPELVENTHAIDPPRDDPSYILDRDLIDHLIAWLQLQETLTPDRPFFAYLAPGSPHTPHHAPEEWIARYQGKFDQGWDAIREVILARQKRMGVIPESARLTPRPKQLPAWESLNSNEKRVAARMMEVYAAQLAHFDYQFGRVMTWLREHDRLENTLVFFIQGDNGSDLASYNGQTNEWSNFFGAEPTYEDMLDRIDDLGGPYTYGGYPAPWGWAMDTPFPWGKALAGYLGGTRNGLVISWPSKIRAKGEIRSQFHHLIDIAPTIYEAAGVIPPREIDGTEQQPIEGVSMAYTFNDTNATGRRYEQYFEMLGNLGYYRDGWLISAVPMRMPWDRTSPSAPLPDKLIDFDWQLFNLETDFSQAVDVANQHPGKLTELVSEFGPVVEKYNVLPLENNVLKLLQPGTRPSLTNGHNTFTYTSRDIRYTPGMLPELTGDWSLQADINVLDRRASGPVFVQGGRFTGWGLLLDRGRPIFIFKELDDPESLSRIESSKQLASGPHKIEVFFDRETNARKGPASVTLRVDGDIVSQETIDHSGIINNTAYIGRYGTTPLVDDKHIAYTCNCEVKQVTLRLM